jgi:hypothetical protein
VKTLTLGGTTYEEHDGTLVPVAEAIPTNGQCRTSWTAVDLLATQFPAPRFAVNGLLPEGLAFMCGAPKLGKSWMALGLAIAVATGGRALGSVRVEAGDVLYLALEDSARRLQSRLRTLLGGREAPQALELETEWPRLDEGGIDKLDVWLDGHPDARLVLVDVWPRIRPRVRSRSADQYTLDYEAAELVQRLAISRGIAVVVLYHTRKAEASDFVETVTGTFGTASGADTIVVVKRGRGQADATLHVTGRDIVERELALRFTPEAGTWTLMGEAAEYNLGETRRELLEAIRAHGTLTPKQAAEITSVGYELAKKTLQRMAADGQLRGDRGSYRTPVPAVPSSPDEAPAGTERQEGRGFLQEADTDA